MSGGELVRTLPLLSLLVPSLFNETKRQVLLAVYRELVDPIALMQLLWRECETRVSQNFVANAVVFIAHWIDLRPRDFLQLRRGAGETRVLAVVSVVLDFASSFLDARNITIFDGMPASSLLKLQLLRSSARLVASLSVAFVAAGDGDGSTLSASPSSGSDPSLAGSASASSAAGVVGLSSANTALFPNHNGLLSAANANGGLLNTSGSSSTSSNGSSVAGRPRFHSPSSPQLPGSSSAPSIVGTLGSSLSTSSIQPGGTPRPALSTTPRTVRLQAGDKRLSLPSLIGTLQNDALEFERFFMAVDPADLAAVLSRIDAGYFVAIPLPELLNLQWRKTPSWCPHTHNMITRSNELSYFVATKILTANTAAGRAQYLSKWIQVALECRALRNFNTILSIIAGLNFYAISRLKESWELTSADARESFASLETLMQTRNNYRLYRDALAEASARMGFSLPYLGVFLRDLTFLEEVHPHTAVPTTQSLSMLSSAPPPVSASSLLLQPFTPSAISPVGSPRVGLNSSTSPRGVRSAALAAVTAGSGGSVSPRLRRAGSRVTLVECELHAEKMEMLEKLADDFLGQQGNARAALTSKALANEQLVRYWTEGVRRYEHPEQLVRVSKELEQPRTRRKTSPGRERPVSSSADAIQQ